MGTTHEVDFGGIHTRGAWQDPSPSADVSVELAVYTKSGQARIAQLDERQLLQVMTEATRALELVRQRRALLMYGRVDR